MVGFRNVVVHGYTSVDVLRISQILAGREYRKLADLALRILEAAGDP
ncbi:MAG: HepT-like ribonuclease domain-containing protein [Thermoproteus sp.]